MRQAEHDCSRLELKRLPALLAPLAIRESGLHAGTEYVNQGRQDNDQEESFDSLNSGANVPTVLLLESKTLF